MRHLIHRSFTRRYACNPGWLITCLAFVWVIYVFGDAIGVAQTGSRFAQPHAERAVERYGMLPVSFEANIGQTDQRVNFLCRGSGYTLWLTSDEVVLASKTAARWKVDPAQRPLSRLHNERESKSDAPEVMRMKLVGANPHSESSGVGQLPTTSNYFIGNSPNKWKTKVPMYRQVRYREVYPGIDIIYHGNEQKLEYDFVVAPFSDTGTIRLRFAVANAGTAARASRDPVPHLDANGNLVLRLNGTEFTLRRPQAYQLRPNSTDRNMIAARYLLHSDGQVGIRLSAYDHSRTLTVDPVVLISSSFLGGSGGEGASSIAVDSSGAVYVAGSTTSADFPLVNPISGACNGNCGMGNNADIFVAKINAQGTALEYSTYIGGSGDEGPGGMVLDALGNIYLTGGTDSSDFPTVNQIPGACRGSCGKGGLYGDGFIAKINATGAALVYSSYIGGSSYDDGIAIAVDSAGNAHVTGFTSSSDFPAINPIPGACRGGCGTGLPGDGFVAEVDPAGTALTYSAFFGGSDEDEGFGIAVDGSGNTYLTGNTSSSDFPVANPIAGACRGSCGSGSQNDAFITKINADASALTYSSYLGGSSDDYGHALTIDLSGNAYVAGNTASADYPILHQIPGACRGSCGSGDTYAVFVTKANAEGTDLIYSSLLGGSNPEGVDAMAIDRWTNLYLTGRTQSTDFPVVHQIAGACRGSCGTGFPGDVFATEINATATALTYSTYLGGSGEDEGYGIAVDAVGNAYLTGTTWSSNFPVVRQVPDACVGSCGSGSGSSDAFVSKIVNVGPNAPGRLPSDGVSGNRQSHPPSSSR